MRFLRMPESEEKRAQERGSDIQVLAMRTPVSRWRPSKWRGPLEGIRDAAADILPAGGQAWLLGQDHPTEDRPVQVGGSRPHSSTGRGGHGHDLLGARLRGDAVQGRIDGRGSAVVLREDGDGGHVRQGYKHPPGDGIRDHRHRVRRQARAAESIRRHPQHDQHH